MASRLAVDGSATRACLTGLVAALVLLTVAAGAIGTTTAQSSAVTITNVTASPSSPTAGETFVVTARIQNAANAEGNFDLTNVYVDTPRGRSYVAQDLGTLSPGSATTVRLPVTVDRPGWRTLELRVHGRDRANSVTVLEQPVPVQIRGDLNERISMAASARDIGPSNRTDLQVTVANGFDESISSVELTVRSDDLTLPEAQRVTSGLPPGNVTRFTFPARNVRPGQHTVDVTLAYTTNAGTRQTINRSLTTDVAAVSEPGRIMLTELDVSPEMGQLIVRGSASNVGTTDVSGVVIGVEGSETAAPADGASTFFVGNVPASDFSSFDVGVRPLTNGTVTIPLEVSYVVDGERTSRVVEVTHEVRDHSAEGQEQAQRGGGGFPLFTVLGVLVVLGVVVFGWRRYRG